jgi:uncharacterized membrane protein
MQKTNYHYLLDIFILLPVHEQCESNLNRQVLFVTTVCVGYGYIIKELTGRDNQQVSDTIILYMVLVRNHSRYIMLQCWIS